MDTTRHVGVKAALRVEWVKARARAAWWSEEVDLLWEEMRRVLVTLCHCVNIWEQHVNKHLHVDHQLVEGITAYAGYQAHLHRALASRFEAMWGGDWVDAGLDADEVDHDHDLGPPIEDEEDD